MLDMFFVAVLITIPLLLCYPTRTPANLGRRRWDI